MVQDQIFYNIFISHLFDFYFYPASNKKKKSLTFFKYIYIENIFPSKKRS